MNARHLIAALDRFGRVLPALVEGLSDGDARWKPADGAWSILEVVCHLGDEEVEDFRRRLMLTLENPAAAWPPIDPERAAVERRYNEGDLGQAVARFCAERRTSVEQLRARKSADWEAAHRHAAAGVLRAGDLLASWVAHDALHVRQIAKRMHQIAARDGSPYTVDYAGRW
jgi:hypothetical protein